MNTTAHDFVTVDMRGLKAALVARAQAQRVSVSELVRSAVARDLGLSVEGEPRVGEMSQRAGRTTDVKLSIRMTAQEASQLAAGARAACLSRGAYLAGLVANVPVLSAGGGRTEHIAALRVSSDELATLSRNIHRLTALLRQANVEPARPYREMLETLAGDVRRHLELAARALADLRQRLDAETQRVAGGVGLGLSLVRQIARSLPDALLEAARMDGAGEWRIFWLVVLPMHKPVIVTLPLLPVSSKVTRSEL